MGAVKKIFIEEPCKKCGGHLVYAEETYPPAYDGHLMVFVVQCSDCDWEDDVWYGDEETVRMNFNVNE